MDAPPPYPGLDPIGSGGWQLPASAPASAPPPYSVNDPGKGNPHLQQGGGNVMVVCGGWDGDRALETVEMFNPRTGQWSNLPNMNVPRRDHGAAVFGEFLYVVGGWNMEPYYTSTERFHLGTRTWSQGPSLSGARGWCGLAVLGEHLYCVGGYDGRDRAVSTVERLHLYGDRWERVADMNKIRGGCGVVAFQNRIYAIGGYDGKKKKKSVEVYDPNENRWRMAEDLPHPREDLGHSCAVFDNHLVIAGGVGEGDKVLSNCMILNPNTQTWSSLQCPLITEKRGVSLAVLDGVMYAAGGEDRNDEQLETVMVYDNSRQVWNKAPSMRQGRAGHGAAIISI